MQNTNSNFQPGLTNNSNNINIINKNSQKLENPTY